MDVYGEMILDALRRLPADARRDVACIVGSHDEDAGELIELLG